MSSRHKTAGNIFLLFSKFQRDRICLTWESIKYCSKAYTLWKYEEREEGRKKTLFKTKENPHYTHFFFQSRISSPFQREGSQSFKINSKERIFPNLIFRRVELWELKTTQDNSTWDTNQRYRNCQLQHYKLGKTMGPLKWVLNWLMLSNLRNRRVT